MIMIWRRPSDSRVYIQNVTEGPADSFEAIGAPGGFIAIRRRYIGIVEVAGVHFSEFRNADGIGFASMRETMDYLQLTFTPEIPELASALEREFVCAEEIPALRLVYVSADDERISVADPSSYESSLVVGMTTANGAPGDRVPVRLFGQMEDASFNFGVNAPLFLDSFGRPTMTAPSETGSGTLTRVGYSLGRGSVFIKTEKPIII